jgi:hypothetical protein
VNLPRGSKSAEAEIEMLLHSAPPAKIGHRRDHEPEDTGSHSEASACASNLEEFTSDFSFHRYTRLMSYKLFYYFHCPASVDVNSKPDADTSLLPIPSPLISQSWSNTGCDQPADTAGQPKSWAKIGLILLAIPCKADKGADTTVEVSGDIAS